MIILNGPEIGPTNMFYCRGIAGIELLWECVNLNNMSNYIYAPMSYNYVVYLLYLSSDAI